MEYEDQIQKIKEFGAHVTLPIVKKKESTIYKLVLIDSAGVIHYFNHKDEYDGYSHDPHLCGATGTSQN